jgi:hypothetical protein
MCSGATRPGNRVKSVVYGASETVTTYYVGTYYEKSVTVDGGGTTTAWKKYYYAGAVRLAMREDGDTPLYLKRKHSIAGQWIWTGVYQSLDTFPLERE